MEMNTSFRPPKVGSTSFAWPSITWSKMRREREAQNASSNIARSCAASWKRTGPTCAPTRPVSHRPLPPSRHDSIRWIHLTRIRNEDLGEHSHEYYEHSSSVLPIWRRDLSCRWLLGPHQRGDLHHGRSMSNHSQSDPSTFVINGTKTQKTESGGNAKKSKTPTNNLVADKKRKAELLGVEDQVKMSRWKTI